VRFAPFKSIFWVSNSAVIWEFEEAVNASSSQAFNRWSRIYLNRLKMLKSLEIDSGVSNWFNIEFKSIKDVKAEFERVKNLESLREWDNSSISLLTAVINGGEIKS